MASPKNNFHVNPSEFSSKVPNSVDESCKVLRDQRPNFTHSSNLALGFAAVKQPLVLVGSSASIQGDRGHMSQLKKQARKHCFAVPLRLVLSHFYNSNPDQRAIFKSKSGQESQTI